MGVWNGRECYTNVFLVFYLKKKKKQQRRALSLFHFLLEKLQLELHEIDVILRNISYISSHSGHIFPLKIGSSRAGLSFIDLGSDRVSRNARVGLGRAS